MRDDKLTTIENWSGLILGLCLISSNRTSVFLPSQLLDQESNAVIKQLSLSFTLLVIHL